MGQPVVSIICTVFNKEKWLEETFEGFVQQKADFPFEILVIDDCSTDGSQKIIQRYAKDYPSIIRTFSNETNLGIARTWQKICQQAKGRYIARCDGDDIWTDPYKLQKQVDALAESQARWCSTDISYIDEEGQTTCSAVFESGLLEFIDSYEQMLVTRGFTAPSTWLIESDLMLEVNQELDLDTADDTFNLQLDLFQRTDKLFLKDVTVAYRVNQGSDSRPKEFKILERRFNRLLETQESYLDKYPQADYKQMTRLLLERNNTYELQLSKPMDSLSHLGLEQVTVYFADEEGNYSQDNVYQKLLQYQDQLPIKVSSQVKKIRIDLSERPSYFVKVVLRDDKGTTYYPVHTNGLIYFDYVLFPDKDPQLYFEFDHGAERELILDYKMMNIDDPSSKDYVGRYFIDYIEEASAYAPMVKDLKKQVEDLTHQYNSVINSRRWTIPTKIINLFKKRK